MAGRVKFGTITGTSLGSQRVVVVDPHGGEDQIYWIHPPFTAEGAKIGDRVKLSFIGNRWIASTTMQESY